MAYLDKVELGSTTYDVADSKAWASIAPVETATATAAHAVGDLIILDGVLYRVTAAIAIGDTITASGGSANIVADTISAERDKTNALALGDFGPDAYGKDYTATSNGLTFTKGLNSVKINGTRTEYAGMFYLSNDTGSLYVRTSNYNQTLVANGANSNCVMRAGHTYRVTAEIISGTFANGTATNNSSLRWYHATAEDQYVTTDYICEDLAASLTAGERAWSAFYTPTADTYVGYGLYSRLGAVFTNLVIRYEIAEIVPDDATITISDSAVTIAARRGVSYICSASSLTSLTFTPCASGLCEVRFKSGTTPTALTVPDTVKWPSWFNPSSLAASVTYDIMVKDGVFGAVMKWA